MSATTQAAPELAARFGRDARLAAAYEALRTVFGPRAVQRVTGWRSRPAVVLTIEPDVRLELGRAATGALVMDVIGRPDAATVGKLRRADDALGGLLVAALRRLHRRRERELAERIAGWS